MINSIGYEIGVAELFYSEGPYGRHYRESLLKEDFAVQLWFQWFTLVRLLRPACTRMRSFLWLTASYLFDFSANFCSKVNIKTFRIRTPITIFFAYFFPIKFCHTFSKQQLLLLNNSLFLHNA